MGRIMKLLARELNLPVIILMDAPCAVDFRREHRLNMSDFSHELMDAVDISLFPYRDDRYHLDFNYDKPVVMEISILKNEYGTCRDGLYVLYDRSKHYIVDPFYSKMDDE